MIPSIRRQYNEAFSEENYNAFIGDLQHHFSGQVSFRVAESPVFIPAGFTQKMLDTCEAVLDRIRTPEYIQQSEKAIPQNWRVPNEDTRPHFIAFDFGICQNTEGQLEPQLIEMQGFPSLFAWQVVLPEIHQRHFWWPEGFDIYLNGFTRETYLQLLRRIIVADSNPENVILLEIFPEKQKTRPDFRATEDFLGITTVCLTELIQEGKTLYYLKDGKKTKIDRIFNRLVFDDLMQQPADVQEKGKLMTEELDVTWVPHPNWFYRLSKYTLPFIRHPYVPETRFLSAVAELPQDLENYVVKPLFSFAGQGVIIDVTKEDVEKIPDPQNWILQRKVAYADAIGTPDGPAKAEIRLFYFWEPGKDRPVAANNLARLSKGKMVGVRYNQDKTWVGGSFALFEQG